MPVLSEAEFDLWWTVAMVCIAAAFAALLLWPFVADYVRACRLMRLCRPVRQRDDLMNVAEETEEIGPAWERIPKSKS